MFVNRKTVIILLSIIDPENTTQRRSRRLKRRIYRSKVRNINRMTINHSIHLD